MIRFSANLSMLFCERAPLERPAAARAAGFEGVEIQFPYDLPAATWSQALQSAGVELAVINAPAGDLVTGGPGLAAMPGRQGPFAAAIEQAAAYARMLRARNVNVLAGWPPPELARERCLDVLAANLRSAAQRLAAEGVRVTLEAVNTDDRPGYLVSDTDTALSVLARAGHHNLFLQHDLYHMHRMRQQGVEGDLADTLRRVLPRIAHIQFADFPGRHEPGTGEIDFDRLFSLIEALPYDGFTGAEYVPSEGGTERSLGWLRARSAGG